MHEQLALPSPKGVHAAGAYRVPRTSRPTDARKTASPPNAGSGGAKLIDARTTNDADSRTDRPKGTSDSCPNSPTRGPAPKPPPASCSAGTASPANNGSRREHTDQAAGEGASGSSSAPAVSGTACLRPSCAHGGNGMAGCVWCACLRAHRSRPGTSHGPGAGNYPQRPSSRLRERGEMRMRAQAPTTEGRNTYRVAFELPAPPDRERPPLRKAAVSCS
jgi:hypothetical protein